MIWSEVITSSIIGIFFIALAIAIISGRVRKKRREAEEAMSTGFDENE